MNPFDYDIQVNQNTDVDEAEKVESQPTILFTVEESDEIHNINPIRMIKLGESKPVTLPTNAGIIINLSKKGTTDEGKIGVVPHHLINLYNEAAAYGYSSWRLLYRLCITSIYGVLYQMGQA
jgi:hypothetical protein